MSTRLSMHDQIQALLYHARSATPFATPAGELCASVPSGLDSRRVLPLRSASFRDWLTANFCREYDEAPAASALRGALRLLEAQANDGAMPLQRVDIRIGCQGDPLTPSKIFLDLANASGEIVEIGSRGWQLAGNFRHAFRDSPAALPLPAPVSPNTDSLAGALELLRLNGGNRTRALAWLTSALRPAGPYPILVLRGPSGSGKSTLARALRACLDPSQVPLNRIPVREKELVQLAAQNWIVALEYAHHIPPKMCDALCSLSSGDAFPFARPILLIASADSRVPWDPPHALAARTLVIELETISHPWPLALLWPQFEQLRPAVLATLLDAAVTALHPIREVDLGSVTRLPDAAVWSAAASPVLGLAEESVIESFGSPSATRAGAFPRQDAVTAARSRRNG